MFSIQFSWKCQWYRHVINYLACQSCVVWLKSFSCGDAIIPWIVSRPGQLQGVNQQYPYSINVLGLLPVSLEPIRRNRTQMCIDLMACQFRWIAVHLSQKPLSGPCVPGLSSMLDFACNQLFTISMPPAWAVAPAVGVPDFGSKVR